MIFTKYLLRCVIEGIKLLLDVDSKSPQGIIGAVMIAVGFIVGAVTAVKRPEALLRNHGIYICVIFLPAILADLFRMIFKLFK